MEHTDYRGSEESRAQIKELSLRCNTQRVSAACVLFLSLLGFILFCPQTRFTTLFYWGAVPLGLLSVTWLSLSLFSPKRPKIRAHLSAHRLYLMFWALACFFSFPFLAGDASVWNAPVSATLLCFLLTALPLLKPKEAVFLFSLAAVLFLTASLLFHAPLFPILYGTGLCLAGFFFSLLSYRQFSALLKKLKLESTTDFLTGILNRKGGMEKMGGLLHAGKEKKGALGVCMIDIDNFKGYNDQFGHIQGDRALQQVSHVLARCLQGTEGFICRFGGEEFLVCIPGEEDADFFQSAQALCNAVSGLGLPTAPDGTLTVSVGLAVYSPRRDGNKLTENDLIERSDKALYAAKLAGRNRVHCLGECGELPH